MLALDNATQPNGRLFQPSRLEDIIIDQLVNKRGLRHLWLAAAKRFITFDDSSRLYPFAVKLLRDNCIPNLDNQLNKTIDLSQRLSGEVECINTGFVSESSLLAKRENLVSVLPQLSSCLQAIEASPTKEKLQLVQTRLDEIHRNIISNLQNDVLSKQRITEYLEQYYKKQYRLLIALIIISLIGGLAWAPAVVGANLADPITADYPSLNTLLNTWHCMNNQTAKIGFDKTLSLIEHALRSNTKNEAFGSIMGAAALAMAVMLPTVFFTKRLVGYGIYAAADPFETTQRMLMRLPYVILQHPITQFILYGGSLSAVGITLARAIVRDNPFYQAVAMLPIYQQNVTSCNDGLGAWIDKNTTQHLYVTSTKNSWVNYSIAGLCIGFALVMLPFFIMLCVRLIKACDFASLLPRTGIFHSRPRVTHYGPSQMSINDDLEKGPINRDRLADANSELQPLLLPIQQRGNRH